MVQYVLEINCVISMHMKLIKVCVLLSVKSLFTSIFKDKLTGIIGGVELIKYVTY